MPLTEPVRVEQAWDKGSDTYKDLMTYVYNQIASLEDGWRAIRTEKVTKWRRLYRGIPRDTTRNFPWKNASNVIIQLIGENVGILQARTLGTIWEIMPIWPTQLMGDWDTEEAAGEQQEAVQAFMNLMGMEPTELDLYRVERACCEELYKFGTVAIKLPWITDMESEVIGQVEGSNRVEFEEFTKYDGPRPEKLSLDEWAATPSASTLEEADFKYHIVKLTKQKLEERFFKGVYKLEEEEKLSFLAMPDRPGPTQQQQEKERASGATTTQGYDNAEWDIHECWFPYRHNGKKFRIICSYHFTTKKCLRCIFNMYPKNEEPWELARFGSDDNLLGYGLCEMLEHYQEEVSTGHNQRVDNRTLANSSILRVDPDSKLDAIFAIYPNALVPARVDEIEKIQLGSNYPSSVEEERLTIELAKARVGTIDPGIMAMGGGTVTKKSQYSAMGTFSVMQAGNRRINVNITDFRYVHLKLGRKFNNQYIHFGIGDRLQLFGKQGKFLQMALDNIKKGRLCIPIRAATSSINKELEKQNDMLLTQVMQRHYMGISQILQAVSNPQLPKEVQSFLVGWIDASSVLMGRILRNFQHDDVDRLLPERKLLKGAANATTGQAAGTMAGEMGAQGIGGAPQGAQSLVQGGGAQPGAIPNVSPASGMGAIPSIPSRTM